MNELKPGWLKRQLAKAEAQYKEMPEWWRIAAAQAQMRRKEWMTCGNCHGEGCSKCAGSGGRYYP